MWCCCVNDADDEAETVRIFDGELTTAENVIPQSINAAIVDTQLASSVAQDEKLEYPPEEEQCMHTLPQESSAFEPQEAAVPEETTPPKVLEEKTQVEVSPYDAAHRVASFGTQYDAAHQAAMDAAHQAAMSNLTVGKTLEIKVTMKRGSKPIPLGLELDTAGGVYAMVTKIVDGAVKNYNATAPPERKVVVGDFITQVNAARGDTKQMGQATMQAAVLELVIRRPDEFSVTIDKSVAPGTLGIDFEIIAVGRSLLIKDIKPGLVNTWNEAHPNLQVKRMDRIIGVNKFKGESGKILSIMKEQSTLELIVARVDHV